MNKLLVTGTELSALTKRMLNLKGFVVVKPNNFSYESNGYDEIVLDRQWIVYTNIIVRANRAIKSDGTISLVDLSNYLKQQFGLNTEDEKPEIAYRIRNDHDVPEIYINGEQAHVASCSYQYVTRDGKQPGINCFIASICLKSEDEGKREPVMHTVSVDQRTGQVFYQ